MILKDGSGDCSLCGSHNNIAVIVIPYGTLFLRHLLMPAQISMDFVAVPTLKSKHALDKFYSGSRQANQEFVWETCVKEFEGAQDDMSISEYESHAGDMPECVETDDEQAEEEEEEEEEEEGTNEEDCKQEREDSGQEGEDCKQEGEDSGQEGANRNADANPMSEDSNQGDVSDDPYSDNSNSDDIFTLIGKITDNFSSDDKFDT